MTINEILVSLKRESGTIAKKTILEKHSQNVTLKKILKYGTDPFIPFNVVKVPKVEDRKVWPDEIHVWDLFFKAAEACSSRLVTGNDAIEVMGRAFSIATEENEKWMRKILKKHLAIGASTKTINKVFPGLIPTFDVSLAQKFEKKRLEGKKTVCIEPKLDGIRCFAIVENNRAVLYARSGKIISNFDDTIGYELSLLPEGCYDGEIMGEDFTALMRQAYRKDNVQTEGTYLALFDFLTLEEWNKRKGTRTAKQRYASLYSHLQVSSHDFTYLKVVPRRIVAADYEEIMSIHNEYVAEGYEGAMIKDGSAMYKFGRGPEIMKLKAFHDVDLKIKDLIEGTGKHSQKLGSVVVEFEGVDVQVGSGFSDELRETVWKNPQDFTGRLIEVRYQEVTPDGSLRFPTFVCFRNDR